MLDRIEQVVNRFEEIEYQMADPAVTADHEKLMKLAQERSDIEPLVLSYRRHQAIETEVADARELIEMEDDAEMRSMAQDEIKTLEAEQEKLGKKMTRLLIQKTRVMIGMCTLRFVRGQAEMRRRCLRPICSACTRDTPRWKGSKSKLWTRISLESVGTKK